PAGPWPGAGRVLKTIVEQGDEAGRSLVAQGSTQSRIAPFATDLAIAGVPAPKGGNGGVDEPECDGEGMGAAAGVGEGASASSSATDPGPGLAGILAHALGIDRGRLDAIARYFDGGEIAELVAGIDLWCWVAAAAISGLAYEIAYREWRRARSE